MPALVALVTPPPGTPAHAAGADGGGASLVPLSELSSAPGGAASALRRGTHGGQSVFLATQPDSDAEDEGGDEEDETKQPAAGSKLLRSLAVASSAHAQAPSTPLPPARPPLSAEAAAALADVAALRAAGNAAFAAGRPEEALESYGQARRPCTRARDDLTHRLRF
jgi:hypothetical protein